MPNLSLKAYAKINLTLEILRRLPSGYHEIRSVMQQLALYDALTLQDKAEGSIEITCDSPEIPCDEQNLAWKAANLVQEVYQIQRGVRISINKRIPVAGGLAGGSSNAAAVLKGLNELWDLKLDRATLMALGAKIGMDVPFFFLGGTALASGRGEYVQALPALPRFQVIVANPGIHISTKEAYQRTDWSSFPDQHKAASLQQAISKGQSKNIPSLFHNDFERIILLNYPTLAQIKERMIAQGVNNALLCGSGASVFGLLEADYANDKVVKIVQDLQQDIPFVVATTTI